MALPRKSSQLEVAVLDALGRDVDTVSRLVGAVGAPPVEVDRCLRWALGADLVVAVTSPSGAAYALTERGRGAVAVAHLFRRPGSPLPPVDLSGVARKVGEMSQQARIGRDAVLQRRSAQFLLDPAVREHAVEQLNRHYVQGVLDDGERERRVEVALSARTHGELASAFTGLRTDVRPPTAMAARGAALRTAADELRRTLIAIAVVSGALAALVVAVIILVVVLNRT